LALLRPATLIITTTIMSFPAFSDLPLDRGHPEHSAWFQWGKEDELGTINHLTNDVVLNAIKEVKIGERISLK
jgi:hypothetical protein